MAIAKAYEDTRLGKNAYKDFEAFVETCCREAKHTSIREDITRLAAKGFRRLFKRLKRPL